MIQKHVVFCKQKAATSKVKEHDLELWPGFHNRVPRPFVSMSFGEDLKLLFPGDLVQIGSCLLQAIVSRHYQCKKRISLATSNLCIELDSWLLSCWQQGFFEVTAAGSTTVFFSSQATMQNTYTRTIKWLTKHTIAMQSNGVTMFQFMVQLSHDDILKFDWYFQLLAVEVKFELTEVTRLFLLPEMFLFTW